MASKINESHQVGQSESRSIGFKIGEKNAIMNRVEDFIIGYEGDQKHIMNFFHSLLTEEFNLIPKLQYNLPFY